MEELRTFLETGNILTIIFVIAVTVFVIFIPGMVALLRNPRRAKLIFIACVPSMFSFWAWFGLLAWAVSGKEFRKKKD